MLKCIISQFRLSFFRESYIHGFFIFLMRGEK